MLKPTEPPIRNVGSAGVRLIPTDVNPDWVQSITRAPVTEVWFNWNFRSVPINWTASIPCNWALPRAPSSAVNFR